MDKEAADALEKRISNFLPSLRVGLDIGEWTGGIAIVRDREVLHAETYTDYHATTLEERRKMRRGRRTRHAKKLRLARLRSWLLRQTLPDPYDLMRRKDFQHPPLQLPQHLPVHRQESRTTSPWCHAVIKGHLNDPSAFVLALTHIFQKRGYKYDARDLSSLSPSELEEFLNSCCLLEQAGSLKDSLKGLVERVESNKLRNAYEKALTREPEPRKALPRQLKEDELKQLVKAFGSAQGLSPKQIVTWEKQLVGLLNKTIREPRFENRVIAGCSWCGKNTPRKSRKGVRELEFKAAVRNIRKDRVLPLDEQEALSFLHLWNDNAFRNKGLKARKQQFDKLLNSLRAQMDMASQLAELCGNDKGRGRANLCVDHLSLAADGAFKCNRHPGWLCKLGGAHEGHTQVEFVGGTGLTERLARNPCRETHEERVLRRLEEVLFDKSGNPRWGIPSLISIEFPKPGTAQTYDCPSCKEKLAIDLKVNRKIRKLSLGNAKRSDPQTSFACPFCNTGLFIKGTVKKPIGDRWEDRPVYLTHDEVYLRKAKGGMKEKKRAEYLRETNSTCVYCGQKIEDRLTMEPDHIFPRARGGPDVDSNLVASCHDCNHPNTGKGDRTPYEWIQRDGASPGGNDWSAFQKRVKSLPLPQRKRDVLLSDKEYYPDNPTALARATARKRAFIARIAKMLTDHGVPVDQIALNYETDKQVVIQAVDGWTTSRLRLSWRFHENGKPNFPQKKDWDLRNHAQDAALIAASPPHTWREAIFVETRPVDDPNKPIPGLAPRSLAPDWKGYLETIKDQKPLVSVLGRYDASWKRGFLDSTFWSFRSRNGHPTQRKQIDKVTAKQGDRIVDPKIKDAFRTLCESYGLVDRAGGFKDKPLPPEALEELRKQFPGIRRVRIVTQPGGKPILIQPQVGPPRQTQAKPGSEGIVLWLRLDTTKKRPREQTSEQFGLSLIRPAPLESFSVPRFEPPIPDDATAQLHLYRHDFIYLGENGIHPEGWYRLKEFSDDSVIALPEEAIPAELRKRMGLEQPGRKGSPSAAPAAPQERRLGKEELKGLLRSFRQRKLRIVKGGQ